MQNECMNRFWGIPGHCVDCVLFFDKEGRETELDKEVETVLVVLLRKGRGFRCPCGQTYERYYD